MPEAREAELVKYAETVLSEVLFSSEEDYPLEETLDRYFTPDFQCWSNDEHYDREHFAQHVMETRKLAAQARITIHEILQDGGRVASRHRFDITTRDGHAVQWEVQLFLEPAIDMRWRRQHEMIRVRPAAPTSASGPAAAAG